MRKGILIGVVLVVVLALFAISRQGRNKRPCRKLMQACQAAGFRRGATPVERKNFYDGCLKPLMNGQTVSGITINTSDAEACKERFEANHRDEDES